MESKIKSIVISAINFYEGGPLSISFNIIDELTKSRYSSLSVVIFVHKRSLFQKYLTCKHIKFIELPLSRRNYLFRLYYEYIYFYFYSKKKKIDLWWSLHDITPNVKATKRVVYCHNPTPFYKSNWKEFIISPKLFLFVKLYKYAYLINLKKNTYIIVQQSWIREKFIELYRINREKMIVAHPRIENGDGKDLPKNDVLQDGYVRFIYPCIPRVFKNIELIARAVKILSNNSQLKFIVYLTIDGSENRYSKQIWKKYNHLSQLRFIGFQDFETIGNLYSKCDALLFPSRLETWGLPLTEIQKFNKKILVCSLPYAYETIGSYKNVHYLDANNYRLWADEMAKIIREGLNYNYFNNMGYINKSSNLDSKDWHSLFKTLFN